MDREPLCNACDRSTWFSDKVGRATLKYAEETTSFLHSYDAEAAGHSGVVSNKDSNEHFDFRGE